MSIYNGIDLSRLAPPEVIEAIDYEAILSALKFDLIARAPELADVLALESEPLTKLLEVCAYRETLLRQRVNDAAHAVQLAHAAGADLEHLAALTNTARLVVTPADETTTPRVPAVMESDDSLRHRAQLAWEGLSTAGPEGAYRYHALSADGAVKDISVSSPTPGDVTVTVLSRLGNGGPDSTLLDAVEAVLTDDDVRPLTDHVTVQAATIIDYAVTAALTLYPGPASAEVLAAAEAAVTAETVRLHALGHDVTRSAIFAALHQPGVQGVALTAPAADMSVDADEAAHCSAITVTLAGRDT